MTKAEFHDEEDDDDSPTLRIETSSFPTEHRRRPWWKSSVGIVMILAILTAIIFVISYNRPQSTSNNSELSTPEQQQQQQQQQEEGSSSNSNNVQGTDSSMAPSSGTTESSIGTSGGSTTATTSPPSTCVEEHFEVCETDRMGHEVPLMAGHALCNHEFRFGVTSHGSFQWHDCAQQVTRVIYRNSSISSFSMSSAGVFQLMDQNNQIIWQKAPKMKISYTKQCLHQPLLDCPYLHLHRDGVLVLNSINNSTGQWSDRNVEKAFENLFQS